MSIQQRFSWLNCAEPVLNCAEPVMNLTFHYEISMLETFWTQFRDAHWPFSTPSTPKCDFEDPHFRLNWPYSPSVRRDEMRKEYKQVMEERMWVVKSVTWVRQLFPRLQCELTKHPFITDQDSFLTFRTHSQAEPRVKKQSATLMVSPTLHQVV